VTAGPPPEVPVPIAPRTGWRSAIPTRTGMPSGRWISGCIGASGCCCSARRAAASPRLLHALTGPAAAVDPGDRRGALRLFGAPVDSRSARRMGRPRGDPVPGRRPDAGGFTVADEIAFALENRNHPPATMAAAVGRRWPWRGLPADWLTRRIGALSGGEKQRVALAATLAQGADLVIADEPTANLAPGAARLLADRILAPGAHGADRRSPARVTVLADDGRPLVEGDPATVFGRHGARLAEAGSGRPAR
jgi:energy-coupling factor transport system ATP-binding protein